MSTWRKEWLKLTIEAPIDPGLPICDAHHHLFDNSPPRFPPYDHYLLEEFIEDVEGGGHNIVKTVSVNCEQMYRKSGPEEMKPVGETEFIQGIATQAASGQYGTTLVAAGIVGMAELLLGDAVSPVLEAHITASRNRFRGIRYGAIWDPSPEVWSVTKAPGLLLDRKFREGFACLQKYGLSFDAWVYHTQLMDLVYLARAFPDTTIIQNHTGGPLGIGPYAGKRQEVFEVWRRGIIALATCPNVFIKLGGIGRVPGFGWDQWPKPPGSTEIAEAMAPYYQVCIEHFGVHRCMFESNFPVDKLHCSYTVLWNAFKRITREYSSEERAALFHDTAVKAYRLT